MKTVRDMFVDALALKIAGLTPNEIASRRMDIAHQNRFTCLVDRSDQGSEQVVISFQETREIIRFDGTIWHHGRL